MNIKFLKWNDNKDTIPGSEQAHHSKQMFEYVRDAANRRPCRT